MLSAPSALRRPPAVTAVIWLLVFLGVTSVSGGAEMIVFSTGNGYLPARWLDTIPLIDSWLLPGLVLGVGFGLGSLITAYGMGRRLRWRWAGPVEHRTGRHWSWSAAVGLGTGMMVWIALELVYLPDFSWLEAVYGLVGVALAGLPLTRAARAHLSTRPS